MPRKPGRCGIYLKPRNKDGTITWGDAMNYLKYLVEEIHTTVVATVDDAGQPVTAAIDMMDYDEGGLYFLTAKGKGFYDRLKKRGTLALTGMKGTDTMHCAALSIRGKVRELGGELLPRLFEKNPYMNEIYPDTSSRSALTVFVIYEGSGEWFDLSKKPIERASFPLAVRKKCRRATLSRTPASAASSAIPSVRRSVSTFPASRWSFSSRTACIAATAMRSVRPEPL